MGMHILLYIPIGYHAETREPEQIHPLTLKPFVVNRLGGQNRAKSLIFVISVKSSANYVKKCCKNYISLL